MPTAASAATGGASIARYAVCGIVVMTLNTRPTVHSHVPHIRKPHRTGLPRRAHLVRYSPATRPRPASGYSQPACGPYQPLSSLNTPAGSPNGPLLICGPEPGNETPNRSTPL